MVASCFFTGHRALCRAKQWPGLSQLENDVKHNTWKQKLAVTLPSSPGSISALSASFCLRNTADLPRGAKPLPQPAIHPPPTTTSSSPRGSAHSPLPSRVPTGASVQTTGSSRLHGCLVGFSSLANAVFANHSRRMSLC